MKPLSKKAREFKNGMSTSAFDKMYNRFLLPSLMVYEEFEELEKQLQDLNASE